MKLAWIQKFTMLDYPWKIATLIFTPWCNFRCNFCYNTDFVVPKKLNQIKQFFIPESSFFSFLEKRVGLIDWVVICWWEPTIHEDLEDFMLKIKNMWFLIKLDTNWSNPLKIKNFISKWIVDYIAMDIKHSIDKLWELVWLKINILNFQQSIELLKNSNIDYEFRTTLIKWVHNIEDFMWILSLIKWSKKYYLQNFQKKSILKKFFHYDSFWPLELEKFQYIAKDYVWECIIR